MEKLNSLLEEMRMRFPQYGLSRTDVSAADVGWHLEHSMLVIRRSIRAVMESDPKTYKRNYDLRAFLFFNVVRKIPRGRTRAPEAVIPAPGITEASLQESLDKTISVLGTFSKAQPKQYFRHGMLGNLDRERTRMLLEFHTRHHLDIIRDIAGG